MIVRLRFPDADEDVNFEFGTLPEPGQVIELGTEPDLFQYAVGEILWVSADPEPGDRPGLLRLVPRVILT